jgi:hypothetical protein
MNLLLLVLAIFAGVALMTVLARRFGSTDPQRLQQLQRWLLPLVGLMLVLSVVKYYV